MELEGFSNPIDSSDEEYNDMANKAQKPSKKASKKSGGFQSMGLNYQVLKGILKKGYKVPTPIQRKTIPLALEGRDIVAMARTGSGKSACFLIPLFEKLKCREAKAGARALILSPTRELALQTLKFIKELGKFTDLKASIILGGDSMDNQFATVHSNPDIIVATPGRFVHICVEMQLNLKSVKYVVFDEADRLFEMGFGEQMNEIVNRLPETRQTLLFSATLPKVLAEFAKAGLSDPVLLRLDVESKLPDGLKLKFITCRAEEKLAVLMTLLKTINKPKTQTIIFAATMHHVEYIHKILDEANISNTFIYSNLDPTARKINTAKFQHGQAQVLIVTDIAARGIDIPQLDNVINFHFPAKSKLFIHRVGRCARAGRTGTAYNIVSPDEYAYLLDLHLFIGKPLNIIPPTGGKNIPEDAIGKLPQSAIETELVELLNWHDTVIDIQNMQQVCNNAYHKYIQTRPGASRESVQRVKDLNISSAGVLPEFSDSNQFVEEFIAKMKSFKPPCNIFEINRTKGKCEVTNVMKATRDFHKESIDKYKRKKEEKKQELKQVEIPESSLTLSNADDINDAFKSVIVPKKRKIDNLYKDTKRKRRINERDEEFYIPYAASDKHTEEGLSVNNFAKEAEQNQVDLIADNEEGKKLQTKMKRWDRKKKKIIGVNDNSKVSKIQTESGSWISASYKSDKYKQWKERNKIDTMNDDEDVDDEQNARLQKLKTTGNSRRARHNQKLKEKVKSELRRPEQVAKIRMLEEKKKKKNLRKKKSKKGRRK